MRKNKTQDVTSQFSEPVKDWINSNVDYLSERFIKKYPTARNVFNIELRNAAGSKRIFIVSANGTVKVEAQASGRKFLPYATVRRLGCPLN
jgi:hypothetical protein